MDGLAVQLLWPRFDPRQIPVALSTRDETLLFRHPNPPPEFASVSDALGALSFRGLHPSLRANTSVDLGGVPTATIMLDTLEQLSLTEIAAVVIHEVFHVFQHIHHPDWSADEMALFVYPLDDFQLLFTRYLEIAALRHALAVVEVSHAAREWALAALHMRRERFARMPEAASAYERGTELHEGLARYVERRAVRNPYVDLPEHGFAPEDLRESCYATGHALAVLLDRVSPSWRQRLEWGKTRSLDGLLNDALQGCQAQEAQFSRDEIEDAAICAGIEVQTAGDRRRAIRDEYLGRPGHRLVVTADKNGPLWAQTFDPSRLARLESGQILHTRWIQLENESCTVEVLGRAALTEAVGDHPLFSGIHTITVTGIEIEPTIEEREGVIVVCSDGVKATCRDARISRDGETTRLRLGKGRC